MKRLFSTLLGLGLLLGPTAGQAMAHTGAPLVIKKVRVVNFAFMPSSVQIAVGTSVGWKNTTTTTTHTTTSDTGLWNHTLPPGGIFKRMFTTPGTFTYHCTIHPSMTGTITVT